MKTKYVLQHYHLFCAYVTLVVLNCHILVLSWCRKFGLCLGLTNMVMFISLKLSRATNRSRFAGHGLKGHSYRNFGEIPINGEP